MKIYTAYTKENDPNPLESIILVEEGFSWLAAILHVFYAIYHKMWVVAAVLFLIEAFLILLESNNYIHIGIINAVRTGFLLYIGASFNDWRRATLERNNYIFQGIVSGKNEDEARYKFMTDMLHRTTLTSGNNNPGLVY